MFSHFSWGDNSGENDEMETNGGAFQMDDDLGTVLSDLSYVSDYQMRKLLLLPERIIFQLLEIVM